MGSQLIVQILKLIYPTNLLAKIKFKINYYIYFLYYLRELTNLIGQYNNMFNNVFFFVFSIRINIFLM